MARRVRVWFWVFRVLGLMTLGLAGVLSGCAVERLLPVHTWETPGEAVKVLGTQNNGLVTFEAVLEVGAGEGMVRDGEGWVPCEARVSFHLYAWQHEKVRVDLKNDGKIVGSAVFVRETMVEGSGKVLKRDMTRAYSDDTGEGGEMLGRVLDAWVLYRRGVFRDSLEFLGEDSEGRVVWRRGKAGESGSVTCRVDATHLLPVVYEVNVGMTDGGAGLARLELMDYQTSGGIAWPTRMKVTDGNGKGQELRMTRVRINEDLPAGVFGAGPGTGR